MIKTIQQECIICLGLRSQCTITIPVTCILFVRWISRPLCWIRGKSLILLCVNFKNTPKMPCLRTFEVFYLFWTNYTHFFVVEIPASVINKRIVCNFGYGRRTVNGFLLRERRSVWPLLLIIVTLPSSPVVRTMAEADRVYRRFAAVLRLVGEGIMQLKHSFSRSLESYFSPSP